MFLSSSRSSVETRADSPPVLDLTAALAAEPKPAPPSAFLFNCEEGVTRDLPACDSKVEDRPDDEVALTVSCSVSFSALSTEVPAASGMKEYVGTAPASTAATTMTAGAGVIGEGGHEGKEDDTAAVEDSAAVAAAGSSTSERGASFPAVRVC